MHRPVVMGKNGMVASGHPLASQAGIDVLKKGGNAFDAAVAVNAVLNVTQPHMCGMGGDVFYLLYSAEEKHVRFLNGSGRSAYKATCDFFTGRGFERIPLQGPFSVLNVPGCVDGWDRMLQRYGTWRFKDLLAAAIDYCENGFPVSHHLSNCLRDCKDLLVQNPPAAKVWLPDGKVPPPGQMIIQEDLGWTFKQIADGGRDAFYRGEVAERLVASLGRQGSPLTLQDLADHHSDWSEPVSSTYRGHTLYTTAPNSQGMTTNMMLNILEGCDLKSMGHNSAEYLHYMVEAKKLAFADRETYISDPKHTHIPFERLLSKEYAAQRRARIDPRRAMAAAAAGNAQGDTTYFAVVDAKGNVVSCIQSIYFPFGSGVMGARTGMFVQNRGAYFQLDQGHINCLAPHKRTLHTLMASVTFRNDKPYLVFGTMGGDGQPQTHAAVISSVIDFGMNIQDAIETPRWVHGSIRGQEPKVLYSLENRIDAAEIAALEDLGHELNVLEAWSWSVGHAQAVLIDGDTAVLHGAADPRGDGYAIGW